MRSSESCRPRTECKDKKTSIRKLLLAKPISKEVDCKTNQKIINDLSVKEFEYNEESRKPKDQHRLIKYYLINKGHSVKRSFIGPSNLYQRDKLFNENINPVELIKELRRISKVRKQHEDKCVLKGDQEVPLPAHKSHFSQTSSSPFLLVGSPMYKEMMESRRIRENSSKTDIKINNLQYLNITGLSPASTPHQKNIIMAPVVDQSKKCKIKNQPS